MLVCNRCKLVVEEGTEVCSRCGSSSFSEQVKKPQAASRPVGQRPAGQRPAGNGGQQPRQGQRPNRPQGQQVRQGQRPAGNGGQPVQRPQGQSGQRPQGQPGQRPQVQQRKPTSNTQTNTIPMEEQFDYIEDTASEVVDTASETKASKKKKEKKQKVKDTTPKANDTSSILDWILTLLQMIVPLWNIVFIILTLKNPNKPKYKKDYILGYLIYFAVMLLISFIVTMFVGEEIAYMIVNSK